MSKIACVTKLKANPGKREALLQCCREYISLFVAGEPGSLRMELMLPHDDDPDTVVVWDVYESAAAIEAHRNGDLLRRFREATIGILLDMSSMRHTMVD